MIFLIQDKDTIILRIMKKKNNWQIQQANATQSGQRWIKKVKTEK
jgi:hypothetical protein